MGAVAGVGWVGAGRGGREEKGTVTHVYATLRE